MDSFDKWCGFLVDVEVGGLDTLIRWLREEAESPAVKRSGCVLSVPRLKELADALEGHKRRSSIVGRKSRVPNMLNELLDMDMRQQKAVKHFFDLKSENVDDVTAVSRTCKKYNIPQRVLKPAIRDARAARKRALRR